MKKTMLLICILFISQISIANPLSWIKNKIGDVWFTYKTWNIPRPRLIGHQKMELDGKKFEEFVYLLREDNVVVKDVRKKLHVSGIYLSNDSDVDVYKVSKTEISCT